MTGARTMVPIAALSLAVAAAACVPVSQDVSGPPTPAETTTPHDHPGGHDTALAGEPVPATTAAAVEVWAEEPPLGPVPDEPGHATTSQAAVRGYLEAAHTVTAADAEIRHRRHHPWLHPAAAGRTGGLWTLDPPPDGVTRRVEFVDLDLVASADDGAAWQVTYRLMDGPAQHAERTRYVTARQMDRQWFVVAETIDLQPVPE